jgi:hypothetical protein
VTLQTSKRTVDNSYMCRNEENIKKKSLGKKTFSTIKEMMERIYANRDL